MTTNDYEADFTKQGLTFEYGQDEPGKVYTPHRHGWTKLVTLGGSLRLRLDHGEWFEQKSGDVCEVGSGQLHEAVVGPDGWEWLTAWHPEDEDSFSSHE